MNSETRGSGAVGGLVRFAQMKPGIDDYTLFQAGMSERGVPLWEFQLLRQGVRADSFVLELDTKALPDFESVLAREVLFPTLLEHHKHKWAQAP